MTFESDRDRRRRTDHAPKVEDDETPRTRKKKRGTTPEVGQALRAAYQQAVNEDIPPEMLDLLGKLG